MRTLAFKQDVCSQKWIQNTPEESPITHQKSCHPNLFIKIIYSLRMLLLSRNSGAVLYLILPNAVSLIWPTINGLLYYVTEKKRLKDGHTSMIGCTCPTLHNNEKRNDRNDAFPSLCLAVVYLLRGTTMAIATINKPERKSHLIPLPPSPNPFITNQTPLETKKIKRESAMLTNASYQCFNFQIISVHQLNFPRQIH